MRMTTNEFQRRLLALHWSQTACAIHLGVSQPYISQLVSGAALIPAEIALAMDVALDMYLSRMARANEIVNSDGIEDALKEILDG